MTPVPHAAAAEDAVDTLSKKRVQTAHLDHQQDLGATVMTTGLAKPKRLLQLDRPRRMAGQRSAIVTTSTTKRSIRNRTEHRDQKDQRKHACSGVIRSSGLIRAYGM